MMLAFTSHICLQGVLSGCADEDSAYLSKRMLRVGTSRQYSSKYTQKGEIIDLSLPAVIPLTVQCSPRAMNLIMCCGSQYPVDRQSNVPAAFDAELVRRAVRLLYGVRERRRNMINSVNDDAM